jgi:hypothetical protein
MFLNRFKRSFILIGIFMILGLFELFIKGVLENIVIYLLGFQQVDYLTFINLCLHLQINSLYLLFY